MRKLSFGKVMAGGGLLVTLVFILGIAWFAKPHINQSNANQMGERESEKVIIALLNDYQQAIQNQLEQLKHQLTVEQTSLRERLEGLQQTLYTHINKSADLAQHELSSGVNAEPVQEELTEQEQRARIAHSESEEQDEIVSQLELEDPDPNWANLAQADIIRALNAAEEVDVTPSNIECRSTFCRIEGVFGELGTHKQAIAHFMTLIPWETRAFFHGYAEESTTGALYIMREGHSVASATR